MIEKMKYYLKLIISHSTFLYFSIHLNTFKNTYFNEKFIKTKEKLQKQIKVSLEKGKLIDEEKDLDYNKLNSYINDCINIEKNINIINNNNKNINELKKIKFEFSPKEYL